MLEPGLTVLTLLGGLTGSPRAIVVGAVNVLPLGSLTVAVCGVSRPVCFEKVISKNLSGFASPVFSILNLYTTAGSNNPLLSFSYGIITGLTAIISSNRSLSLGSRNTQKSEMSAKGCA